MRLGVEAALVGDSLVPGDVEIADGVVAAVGLGGAAGRGIAAPGFVDLQVNGFAGVDFHAADVAGYRRAGEWMLATGVTAFQPTFVTAAEDDLVASLREMPPGGAGPRIIGAHLEGPFLSPLYLGAHDAAFRRDPDVALLARLLAAGRVSQVTLAPELPGAPALIDALVARRVLVSCGHTNATAAEAHLAFDRGARSVTHLFNAMRAPWHRDPGIAFAALSRPDVVVQVIADGRHLAPETLTVAWRAAAGRLAVVTDAVAAAGAGDGRFRLGPVAVESSGGVVRRDDGELAGSTLTMIQAVRTLHELGAPLEAALAAAGAVPAALVGAHELGRIAVGAPADLVVLDDRLEVRRVLVNGGVRVAD